MTSNTKRKPIAFVAGGQGSQFSGMGIDLYTNDRVFRNSMKTLLNSSGPELKTVLKAWLDRSDDALSKSTYAQTLLIALCVSHCRSLGAHGIHPSALLGHSAGELALGAFAGLMEDDALPRFLERRYTVLQRGPEGTMCAVRSSPEVASELIEYNGLNAWVACVNSPTQCLVSADSNTIREFITIARAASILAVPAASDMPFHSPLVRALSQQLAHILAAEALTAPEYPLMSAATTRWLSASEAEEPRFWSDQLWRPVQFWDAFDALVSDGDWVFVDLGPGTGLSAVMSSHPKVRSGQSEVVSMMPPTKESDYLSWLRKVEHIQAVSL